MEFHSIEILGINQMSSLVAGKVCFYSCRLFFLGSFFGTSKRIFFFRNRMHNSYNGNFMSSVGLHYWQCFLFFWIIDEADVFSPPILFLWWLFSQGKYVLQILRLAMETARTGTTVASESRDNRCENKLGMYPRLVVCQYCKNRSMTTVWCQKISNASALHKLIHRCPSCSAVIGVTSHSHEQKKSSCSAPKRRRKIGYVKFSHNLWDQEMLSSYYQGRWNVSLF